MPRTFTEPEQLGAEALRQEVPDRALDVLVRCFADSIQADASLLVERPRNDKGPRLLAAWDRNGPPLAVPSASGSLLDRAIEAGGAIVESAGPTPSNGDAGDPISAVAAPVRFRGHAFGAVYAGFAAPSILDSGLLCWTAESYARLAEMCLADEWPLAAVLAGSGTDTLTGCLTYASLIEMLEAEMMRSQRQGHRLSCCFLDLDGFKLVNDADGHLGGNRVLAAVGPALIDAARRYDAVARFGGDEFVVVLPETGIESARRVAERLRAGVLATIGTVTDVPVDASIGIAEWDREDTAMELLDAADRALTQAKQDGGGRIVTRSSGDRRYDGLQTLTREVMRGRDGPATSRGARRGEG